MEFQDCCPWLGEQSMGSDRNEEIAEDELAEWIVVDEVKVGEDEETLLEEETAGKKRVKENGMLGVARDAGICRDMQHNTCHGSGTPLLVARIAAVSL